MIIKLGNFEKRILARYLHLTLSPIKFGNFD